MSDPHTFYNLSERNMRFSDVFERMLAFIKSDPKAEYNLSIGTDSQVHQEYTKFITAIHIHRIGKGAWGCLCDYRIPREIKSLHEKISLETTLSQEVAFFFTPKHFTKLTDLILPHLDDGADFNFEIHLDIGRKGLTKDLIQEMTGRISATGFEARIKPDSYCATSYANRYTK